MRTCSHEVNLRSGVRKINHNGEGTDHVEFAYAIIGMSELE